MNSGAPEEPSNTVNVVALVASLVALLTGIASVIVPITTAPAPGLQGERGPVGPTGPTGVVGDTGVPGFLTNTGPQGPVGSESTSTGPTGPIGTIGTVGFVGPSGSTGDIGPTGSDGNGLSNYAPYVYRYFDFNTAQSTSSEVEALVNFPLNVQSQPPSYILYENGIFTLTQLSVPHYITVILSFRSGELFTAKLNVVVRLRVPNVANNPGNVIFSTYVGGTETLKDVGQQRQVSFNLIYTPVFGANRIGVYWSWSGAAAVISEGSSIGILPLLGS